MAKKDPKQAEAETGRLDGRERQFFESNLTYAIMVLANMVARNTQQTTLRETTLNLAEWRVLRIVEIFGPLSATDCGTIISMDKTTVSRTVTKLHDLKLLKFTANPADRRETLVQLTQAGQRLHDKIISVDTSVDSSFEKILGKDDLVVFRRALSKLREHAATLLTKSAPPRKTRAPSAE